MNASLLYHYENDPYVMIYWLALMHDSTQMINMLN